MSSNDVKKISQMRDLMREAADILDDFVKLKQREIDGENITGECDAIIGRFFVNTMKRRKHHRRMRCDNW